MSTKLVTATKRGGSIIVPLTGLVEEGEQYIVEKVGNKIVLRRATEAIKKDEW